MTDIARLISYLERKDGHGVYWTNCVRYQTFRGYHEEHKAKSKKSLDAKKLFDIYTNTQYFSTAGIKEKIL